jgi:hypothetical protein
MNEEFEVLKLVCGRLDAQGLLYMVTGSIAANLYTVPRMTRDIDMVIDVKAADAGSFHALFKDDFYLDLQTVKDEIQRRGMFNIIHNEFALKVDFIVRKHSPYHELEFARRTKVVTGDIQIPVVSIEDLILSKLSWAKDNFSTLQLRDVKNLLNSANKVDNEYLNEWISRLNLDAAYRKALE